LQIATVNLQIDQELTKL